MIKTISILFFSFLAINLSAQKYVGDQKDINQILNNIKSFSQHVMNSHYDSIALSYTKDGKIFPNNIDIVEGREKVKTWWVLPEGTKTTYHKVTPVEIVVNGEFAYDYGYYEGKSKRGNAAETPFKGKYVIVWKKEGEDWKVYLDIWNNIRD